MSGFVGMIHFDDAPVDPELLKALTNQLAFRGPDAQEVWFEGGAGLGHALLQISSDSPLEKQPSQLEDRLWIVADARIDARTELIRAVHAKKQTTRPLSLSTSDADLILHAYDIWGESCVEHLLGDFSFAIWDARKKKLFSARDHFGIKLFYYAQMGSCLIFSNTLDCVRKHPGVSGRLNDLAIADFLLFDSNQDVATTAFADIQRLPPAHVLACEPGKLSIRRYWELSVTTPIHHSRKEECVERFRELFDTAVADRMRAKTAGVLMSGGLDSSTVAASAQRILTGSGDESRLHAYTQVYDSLIQDEERRYATLVADKLKIPIQFLPSDEYRIFEGADRLSTLFPEPVHSPFALATLDQLRQAAAESRVLLTGDGGDPGFSSRISVHFRQLIANRQFGRAFGDVASFLSVEGRLSRLYLRTRWSLLFASPSQTSSYPGWLEQGLEKRLGLRDRWMTLMQVADFPDAVRPEAQGAFADTMWQSLFEGYDAGVTRIPVEVCHPFFDLRMLSFLLALPRLPWCSDKELLREAGRGVLPDAVRLRRKAPLQADPLVAFLKRPEASWVDHFEQVLELERYVVRDRVPSIQGVPDSWAAWVNLRPLSLNFWLLGCTG